MFLFSLLTWTPVIGVEPSLMPKNLILTNYICRDPIFKQDHILRLWVDKNLLGDAIKFHIHCVQEVLVGIPMRCPQEEIGPVGQQVMLSGEGR